jgi:hypothetical protein
MNPDNPSTSTSSGRRAIDPDLPKAPREPAIGRERVAERGEDRVLSHGSPARPLLGVLPIARWIPQDVHSVIDYARAAAVGSGALFEDCDDDARVASYALAASAAGVSALTDYRLSIANVIPIEAHEAIDHLWGIAAIAAPFVFGYWKTAPRVALMHVVSGTTTILASLFTDYRSISRAR